MLKISLSYVLVHIPFNRGQILLENSFNEQSQASLIDMGKMMIDVNSTKTLISLHKKTCLMFGLCYSTVWYYFKEVQFNSFALKNQNQNKILTL